MRWILIVATILFASIIDAAPLPKKTPIDPVIRQLVPVPDLAAIGRTNYGFFVQIHRDIVLAGGSCWTANGVVREDGSIFLSWYGGGNDSESPAYIGVYRFDGKELRGTYCVPSAITYDVNGVIVGTSERIYPIEP